MSHPDRIPWWRRIWQSVVPPMPDFEGMLRAQAANLCDAVNALAEHMASGDDTLALHVNQLVEEGHRLRDNTLGVLYRSFITPIDREDIYTLSMAIDHVLDYIKNTMREAELLKVDPDDWMARMTKELASGAASLAHGLERFNTGQARSVTDAVLTRSAERRVEDLYRDALRDMFEGEEYRSLADGEEQPSVRDCLAFVVRRMKRREVYRHLSNAADRLAHAGEALRDISIKYDGGGVASRH